MRKAVIDADRNWLTRAQAMEMALDAVIQKGRLESGGVAELRGNGQLIRRSVLQASGGFNEDTVTDDLDLSFRLLTHGALVGISGIHRSRGGCTNVGCALEAASALGGRRPSALFRLLAHPHLSKPTVRQRWDLACFFLLQYGLPVVSFADLSASLVSRSMPTYWPLSVVAFTFQGWPTGAAAVVAKRALPFLNQAC